MDNFARSCHFSKGTVALWLQERVQRAVQVQEGRFEVYCIVSLRWRVQ